MGTVRRRLKPGTERKGCRPADGGTRAGGGSLAEKSQGPGLAGGHPGTPSRPLGTGDRRGFYLSGRTKTCILRALSVTGEGGAEEAAAGQARDPWWEEPSPMARAEGQGCRGPRLRIYRVRRAVEADLGDLDFKSD